MVEALNYMVLRDDQYLVVTPRQLAQGYVELVPWAGEGPDEPVKTIERAYVVLEKLPDGNYVVEWPPKGKA